MHVWVFVTLLFWGLLVLHGHQAWSMLTFARGTDAAWAAWIALLLPPLLRFDRVRAVLRRAWRALDDPFARAGAALVLVLVLVAVFAPLLATQAPDALGDPVTDRYRAPSAEHWLGTDLLGRDLYSRLVHGARVSLGIGVASVALSVGLGLIVGALAGWMRGIVDGLLMRGTDLALAFPRLFLVLLLVAFVEPGPVWIVIVLGLTGWMGVARVVRGQVLQLREVDYVVAATALGLAPSRVVTRHVLPAILGSVIALSTLRVGNAILAESFLSFLGLGVQDPWVSWGLLIREGRDMLLGAWWLALFPGIAIVSTVLGFNLLGDGLRDAFDPRPKPGTGALDD
jgi:peptide/nickel transport system permease protein